MNRSDVENVLLEIGIPAGIKGFKYITDAIMTLDDPKWNQKGAIILYNRIAEMNNTTGSRVERSIRHAFGVARDKNINLNAIEYYIGTENCKNYSSLKMLYTRIRQEREEKKIASDDRIDCALNEEKIRKIVREELKAIMGGF